MLHQPQHSHTDRLMARIAELEEDSRQIREEIGATPSVEFIVQCKALFGLSPARAKMLSILLSGKVKSKNGIWLAYCDPSKDRPDISIITTTICYLRKAMKPYGVTIDTVWGEGWVMGEASCRRVQALLGDGASG